MTRQGFLTRAALGVAAVFAIAEGALAVGENALPEPIEFYSATAQAKAHQMEERARARKRSDVVFVGPSTVFRAVNVDVFERHDRYDRSGYNAGLSGGYPPVMRRWVTEEIVPHLRPRTVVYGLSSLDFHDRIFRGSVRAYETARATRRDPYGKAERTVAQFFRLFRYRKLLSDPAKYDDVRDVVSREAPGWVERELRTLSPAGFRPKEPISVQERLSVDRAILRGFDVGSRGTRNVGATVANLRARGIRVVFVNMPVPQRFVDLHPRGDADYRRFEAHLRRLANELDVELLEPPRSLRRGDLFADNVHYNALGAERFTRWLARELSPR